MESGSETILEIARWWLTDVRKTLTWQAHLPRFAQLDTGIQQSQLVKVSSKITSGMTLLEKTKVVLLATWLGKFSPFARSEKETHDFLGISSIYALLFRKVFLLVEGNVFFSVNSAVLLSKDSETFAKSHVHHKIPQSFYIPHGTRYRFRLTSYGNSFNFLHLRE